MRLPSSQLIFSWELRLMSGSSELLALIAGIHRSKSGRSLRRFSSGCKFRRGSAEFEDVYWAWTLCKACAQILCWCTIRYSWDDAKWLSRRWRCCSVFSLLHRWICILLSRLCGVLCIWIHLCRQYSPLQVKRNQLSALFLISSEHSDFHLKRARFKPVTRQWPDGKVACIPVSGEVLSSLWVLIMSWSFCAEAGRLPPGPPAVRTLDLYAD